MTAADKLLHYFTDGLNSSSNDSIGIEVETSFIEKYTRRPITRETSQLILASLCKGNWRCATRRGDIISAITNESGDIISYDLGRQNIELSAAPSDMENVIPEAKKCLAELYAAAEQHGSVPFFGPVLPTDEDLLVIPDERDATWIRVDGRGPLNLLAKTSAVQFTIEVTPAKAIEILNRLGYFIYEFLGCTAAMNQGEYPSLYPQEINWRRYISESAAGYDPLRYGGPLQFKDLEDYCIQLSRHQVVTDNRLVPCTEESLRDISLFLRSIWWYFRLRRYGNRLCIEVRPNARGQDQEMEHRLALIRHLVEGTCLSLIGRGK